MTDPIRIEFDTPIQRESVAEMVVRRILDMVKSGVLKAGDALPPERDLAVSLDVSRPSVREAMRGLAVLGVVKSRQGGGAYISDLGPDALLGPLPERQRRFIRYFTITHLHNAQHSSDELQTYRHGFSKLINGLSWNRTISAYQPVDTTKTILRIDLHNYNWNAETLWEKILDRYPYGRMEDSAHGRNSVVDPDGITFCACRLVCGDCCRSSPLSRNTQNSPHR